MKGTKTTIRHIDRQEGRNRLIAEAVAARDRAIADANEIRSRAFAEVNEILDTEDKVKFAEALTPLLYDLVLGTEDYIKELKTSDDLKSEIFSRLEGFSITVNQITLNSNTETKQSTQ